MSIIGKRIKILDNKYIVMDRIKGKVFRQEGVVTQYLVKSVANGLCKIIDPGDIQFIDDIYEHPPKHNIKPSKEKFNETT